MTGDEEQNELVHQLGDCTACNVAAGCSGKQSDSGISRCRCWFSIQRWPREMTLTSPEISLDDVSVTFGLRTL